MSEQKTVLAITGIGGFIGSRAARLAIARGWQVQGIDISETAAGPVRSTGARVVVGDINDPLALGRAFEGADAVLHTAAIVAEDGPEDLYRRVNVDGTRSVCEAARMAGVRRLAHLSSIMVYGFDYPQDVEESGPCKADGNIYNQTKLESERIALSFDDPEQGFSVVVIRPGDVYGPGGQQWMLRPLEMIRRHQFVLPDYGRGVINHVHVDNLLDGVFLALASEAHGEAFNITDGSATPCSEFYDYHRRMAGARWLPRWPTTAVKALLHGMEFAFGIFSAKPPARPAAVRFLTRRSRISNQKARRQLGYEPAVSLEQGMREVAASLRESGQTVYWP